MTKKVKRPNKMSQEIPIAILSLHPSGSRVAAGIKKAQQVLSQIKKAPVLRTLRSFLYHHMF